MEFNIINVLIFLAKQNDIAFSFNLK